MPTKYLAYKSDWNTEIKKIEIERETDKLVFVYSEFYKKAMRRFKQSSYENYFDTWDEAHQFLLNNARRRVKIKNTELRHAKKYLQKVTELEHPKD